MSLKYKIVERKLKLNGVKKEVQMAATPPHRSSTSIEHLITLTGQISSISRGDVLSVLSTFNRLVAMELEAGNIVSLGELGSMRFVPRSKAIIKGGEFKNDSLKKPSLIFVPGMVLREAQGRVKYTLVDKKGIVVPPGGGNPSGTGI